MKNGTRSFALIFFILVLSSCQKEFSVEEGNLFVSPVIYDAAAKKFIDTAAITDSTQKIAINNFVTQLKDSGLWTKFIAIYPMVGGTASTTKWNLIDPRDLDAAYRLTFYGIPVYSAAGVLFPTLSDYADTHVNDSILNYNDNSISYYSGTQNTISGYDMGCHDSVSPYNEMAIYHAWDASNWFGYFDYGPKPANTIGLFMFSSTASNVTRYENGSVINSNGKAPAIGFTGYSILIGKVLNAPVNGRRVCQLATIGYGLTDAQAFTFYNIAQNFETSLGR